MEQKRMTTSPEGLALIRQFEGCVLKAYKCPAGVWTIGYGHTLGVNPGDKINQKQAEEYLQQDVQLIEDRLNYTFPWLTQNQFDTLVSFIFNLGWRDFRGSTLYKRIEVRASDRMVCEQMLRWVYANQQVLLGLMKRRVAEANLWMGRQAYKVVMKDNHAKIVAV